MGQGCALPLSPPRHPAKRVALPDHLGLVLVAHAVTAFDHGHFFAFGEK
jgi:hypothetical protein